MLQLQIKESSYQYILQKTSKKLVLISAIFLIITDISMKVNLKPKFEFKSEL